MHIKRFWYGLGILLVALLAMLHVVFVPTEAYAATTSLTIKKLANDGVTVLNQRTVTYQELRDGILSDGTPIPIMGDGIKRYYHQGPVFIDHPDEATEQQLRWNQEEDTNWDTKDMGALKGTNVKDLCQLVGGMADGDRLQVKSSDGWSKYFAYMNVYQYSEDREGPMVICWYKDGKYPDSGYTDGMRLIWFAGATYKEGPTSIEGLPSGYYHVFGNWDWHEAADPEYWYYYMQGGEKYPTTTGLSGQYVNQLTIYSNETPPIAPEAAFSADTTLGDAPLTVQFTDQSTNAPTAWAWDFDNDGTVDSTEQNPTYEYSVPGTYSVKLTVTNAAGSADELKTDYITVNPAPVNAEIQLSTNSGIPGVTIFITGSGFHAGTAGTVWFDTNGNEALDDGEPAVCVNTDPNGAIPLLTSINVPSASTGSYTVRADIPSGGDFEASASFTITNCGIIVNPTNGNNKISSSIGITGSGFAPSTSFRLFCDRNGNGIFDDGSYRSGTTTASGEVSVTGVSWPASPTGIYNFLLDLNNDGTIEASAGICVTPGIKISTPKGDPGTNIGMNIDGFSGNATGYVWFDTNGNGEWDEGENQAPVTTSASGTATSPGLTVPSVTPGIYQVCAEIPASGLKAPAATYTIRGVVPDINTGTAGTTIGITGFAFAPNKTSGYYIWFDTNGNGTWDADESKVDVTTDANGDLFPASLIVPEVPVGDYNICASFAFPVNFAVFTIVSPKIVFTIDGDALATSHTFTLDQLKALPATTVLDNKSRSYTGVTITELLATLGTDVSNCTAILRIKDGDRNPLDVSAYSNYVLAYERDGIAFNDTIGTDTMHLQILEAGGGNIKYVYGMTLTKPAPLTPVYTVSPVADPSYTAGTNPDGITTMTVNTECTGLLYFGVTLTTVVPHEGNETVVFTHTRNGNQLGINATKADFDQIQTAIAGFNVQAGDQIKVFVVDNLTNDINVNPVVFQ